MKGLALLLLRGYKRYLSPVMPTACRYVPTCSEYAMEAIERDGVLRGGAQAIWRFLRCNPFGGHGYDPVHEDDARELHSDLSVPVCPTLADMAGSLRNQEQRNIS